MNKINSVLLSLEININKRNKINGLKINIYSKLKKK